jgi:hypothetical protein
MDKPFDLTGLRLAIEAQAHKFEEFTAQLGVGHNAFEDFMALAAKALQPLADKLQPLADELQPLADLSKRYCPVKPIRELVILRGDKWFEKRAERDGDEQDRALTAAASGLINQAADTVAAATAAGWASNASVPMLQALVEETIRFCALVERSELEINRKAEQAEKARAAKAAKVKRRQDKLRPMVLELHERNAGRSPSWIAKTLMRKSSFKRTSDLQVSESTLESDVTEIIK